MDNLQRAHHQLTRLLLGLTLILLVACGTLEVGLEETDIEPDTSQGEQTLVPGNNDTVPPTSESSDDLPAQTPEPFTIQPDHVLEFVSYSHPQLGYQIPVPNGAQIEQSNNGSHTRFVYEDSTRTFVLEVEVFSELPQHVSDSTEAFVRWVTGEETVPVATVQVDGGKLDGATVYSLAEGEAWCDEVRIQHTAFIVENIGYVISIRSEALDQCDAETIPETVPLINSFRLPLSGEEVADTTPVATDTAEVAATPLQVAYTKNANVWLWSEEQGPVALTKNGGVENVMLSDDGRRIAFIRGGNIWAVNSDGTDERQLTTDAVFEGISYGQDWDPYIIDIMPFQMEWQPGSHTLFFNTYPQLEGPGLMLTGDLWSIDADNGKLTSLLPPQGGGRFDISPDGKHIAIITPGSISLLDGTGQNKREVFTYTPILTYSEFEFYAEPTWSTDSSMMGVAIPPADPLASPDQLTSIWYIPTDGRPAQLKGNIASANAPLAQTIFSPDLRYIAYLTGESQTLPPSLPVALSEIGESGISDPIIISEQAASLVNWSPGGQHLIYSPAYDGVARQKIVRIGNPPISIGDNEVTVMNTTWIDASRYIYLQQDGRGWTLYMSELDSDEEIVIDGVVGSPPVYDVNE